MQISKFIRKISKIIVIIVIIVVFSLLTCTLTINQTSLVLGQTSETSQKSNIENLAQLNSLTPISNVVYQPIKIDGREIFKVAAIAGKEIQGNSNTSPLNIRVRMYENNLKQTIKNCFDPDTLKLTLETQENQTLVFASDAEDLKNKFLIAITDLDAKIHGISREDLANQIIGFMRNALIRAQRERQADYLITQLLISLGIIIGLILFSFLILICQKYGFNKYQARQELIDNFKLQNADLEDLKNYINLSKIQELTTTKPQLNAGIKQQLIWQKKQDKNSFFRGCLQVSHIVLWLCGIGWILGNFPDSRWLQIFLFTNVIVLTIILGTYLTIKGSPILINWFATNTLDKLETKTSDYRKVSRAITISRILKEIVIFTLVFIGIFCIFKELNISIIPVLVGLGIISFTIAFGADNLVRDVINGILILLEDQYAIGDIIDFDDGMGYVENMNLRMTQLRDAVGRLSTIPNSKISTVHNLTKD